MMLCRVHQWQKLRSNSTANLKNGFVGYGDLYELEYLKNLKFKIKQEKKFMMLCRVSGFRSFCGGGLADGCLGLGTGRKVTRCFGDFSLGSDGCSVDGGDGVLDRSDRRLGFSLNDMSLGCFCDSSVSTARYYW